MKCDDRSARTTVTQSVTRKTASLGRCKKRTTRKAEQYFGKRN